MTSNTQDSSHIFIEPGKVNILPFNMHVSQLCIIFSAGQIRPLPPLDHMQEKQSVSSCWLVLLDTTVPQGSQTLANRKALSLSMLLQ